MSFYEAARAPDKASCEAHIEEIAKLNAAAGRFIRNAARHEWAMYATRGNVVLDQVTSNMSESVNSMMGEEVRLFCHLRFTFSLSFCLFTFGFCAPHPVQAFGCRRVRYLQFSLRVRELSLIKPCNSTSTCLFSPVSSHSRRQGGRRRWNSSRTSSWRAEASSLSTRRSTSTTRPPSTPLSRRPSSTRRWSGRTRKGLPMTSSNLSVSSADLCCHCFFRVVLVVGAIFLPIFF